MRVTTRGRRAVGPARSAALGLLAAGVAVAGLAVAAGASGRLVVSTARSSRFGTILVSGNTLYTLKPSHVACRATCLKYWPAVLPPKGTRHATAGTGVTASKLGTVKLGTRLQVTYGGKALYWFARDTGPGQVKGNITDTWGVWSVVVTKRLGTGSTTTTAPSGGGGGGAGF